jgi:sugar lactone lactonase YvrE
MKTIEKPSVKSVLKLALLAVLVLAFSCSPDPVLNAEDLDAANARSKYKNDKKSGNAKLKTLVKGAKLNAANGLDVGPDGNLYIASVNGQEVVVMNKNNGKILNRFGQPDVLGADDLVFSPDGSSFYYTDILAGFVGRMTSDGTRIGYQSVAQGVNPIRFSKPNPGDPESEPRLFTALDFLGDGLYELDPELIDPPRQLISCPGGFCLGFFNSFDTRWEEEDDGYHLYLYGPLFAMNLVIAIDITNITETKVLNNIILDPPSDIILSDLFNDEDIRVVAGLDGSLENPAAAKFGPDGMLYVLDQAGKVFKINSETGDKTLFTALQPGLDNMTFDDDGSLYMTNNDEGWVAEILPSGQARIISPGGIIVPQGLAVLAGPNNQDVVYAADLFNLRQFNGTSGQQENIYKGYLVPVTPDVGLASLILPMNVSADGDNLIICSFFSPGLQVWNPEEGVIEDYSLQVAAPIDAVRANGKIVMNDLGLGGIFEVNEGGNTSLAPGLFSGLATDGETVWAADYLNGDIVEIASNGDITVFDFDLEGPEGLALDQNGHLLVIEAGADSPRLSRIEDLSSGETVIVVEGLKFMEGGLEGFPPFWFFDDVEVGPSGDIYITGAGENAIYKVK